MLARLCRAPPIEKRRYVTRYGAHVWEIDVCDGLNAPLVLAEFELTRPEESVTIPPWIGAEVTHDPRYLNAYLARHPFAHWAANERAANDRETNET